MKYSAASLRVFSRAIYLRMQEDKIDVDASVAKYAPKLNLAGYEADRKFIVDYVAQLETSSVDSVNI